MADGFKWGKVSSMPVKTSADRRSKIRADIDGIRRFLREWDPIGVIPALMEDGLPPAEYDSYADGVYTLLSEGGDVASLISHLMKLRTETMELPADLDRDREIAQRIVEWWKAR